MKDLGLFAKYAIVPPSSIRRELDKVVEFDQAAGSVQYAFNCDRDCAERALRWAMDEASQQEQIVQRVVRCVMRLDRRDVIDELNRLRDPGSRRFDYDTGVPAALHILMDEGWPQCVERRSLPWPR